MIDGWMPSVGSSSTSSFGRITSARPMASCCCWPPERSPPRRRSMCFSTGNRSKMSAGIVAVGALQRREAGFEVLPAPSAAGRSRGPAARRRCRAGRDRTARSGRAPCPRRRWLPLASACWPTIARSKLVLPTPLRPSTQVILPALRGERHAAQRLGGAVVEVDLRERRASWRVRHPTTRSSVAALSPVILRLDRRTVGRCADERERGATSAK